MSESKHARGEYGRFSGTDDERIEDLLEALQDPSIDYILCSRGGYGLQRIIDRIYSQISKWGNGKINKSIIGFSDITALHQLWALSKTNVPTIHGLMCKHIATLPEDSLALQLFRQVLNNEILAYTLTDYPLNRLGTISGTLIGGNLSVLYGLQGTPYSLNAVLDAHEEGCVLFIEDINEQHYHIDRMMRNLRMSGVLGRIKGLIVGQFTNCDSDSSMNTDLYGTIYEAVADYSYPVLFGFPAGHVDDNRPLRFNSHINISNLQITQ